MLRILFSFSTCLVLSFGMLLGQSTQPDKEVMKADNAVKAQKFSKALKRYEKVLETSPENKHALMGVAYTTLIISENQKIPFNNKKLLQRSIDHAKKAYEMSAMSTDANYMMALCLNRFADEVEPAERLKIAQDIQKHVEYTLRFEKENAGAYYLLGRSYYLRATLPYENRTDKMMPVHQTLEKAIENYKKAIALQSDRVRFHYALALAYEEDLRSEEALASVNQALKLTPTPEDGGESIMVRCQELKFMID